MINKNNNLLPRAKELRKDMTPQERKLWYCFFKNYPIKVYKQRIIESFIADFYCHAAKLVIEVDGSQHFTENGEAYDKERSRIIESYGIKVIRISNYDVDKNFYNVCTYIDNEIKKRLKR